MSKSSNLVVLFPLFFCLGRVYTTVKSASKERVAMEILGRSGHVTLLVFPAVRFFPTPLGSRRGSKILLEQLVAWPGMGMAECCVVHR